jgi:hypothetical protein
MARSASGTNRKKPPLIAVQPAARTGKNHHSLPMPKLRGDGYVIVSDNFQSRRPRLLIRGVPFTNLSVATVAAQSQANVQNLRRYLALLFHPVTTNQPVEPIWLGERPLMTERHSSSSG